MSIPTLQGLQTALSGLIAEQTALDTTGNNIANANTEGYSRETALLEPTRRSTIPAISSLTGQGAQLGTGVTVATITRIRNIYLDAQYRTQNSALSGAEHAGGSACAGAGRVQRTVERRDREPAVELLERLEQPRRTRPPAKPPKQGVVAAGEQLASAFNELSAQLSTVSAQAGEQYNALDRALRRSRRLRQPDRAAQRPDQARRRSRPAAQRHARPSRPAARQALGARQRHGHRRTRPHRHGELRRRRQTARRRHHGQLAAGR